MPQEFHMRTDSSVLGHQMEQELEQGSSLQELVHRWALELQHWPPNRLA
jgi:hypothetical protein